MSNPITTASDPRVGEDVGRECCVPDAGEPSFVLLGRDPQAPGLVELWAHERSRLEPNSPKPAMACEIADRMRAYKLANPDRGLQVPSTGSEEKTNGADWLDQPIGGELVFDGMRFGKGVPLRTVIKAAQRWRRDAVAAFNEKVEARRPAEHDHVVSARRIPWEPGSLGGVDLTFDSGLRVALPLSASEAAPSPEAGAGGDLGELVSSAWGLLRACEADMETHDPTDADDEPVGASESGPTAVQFGHMRRLRKALLAFRDGKLVASTGSGEETKGEPSGPGYSSETTPSGRGASREYPSRTELDRLSEAASQGEWTVERMENEGASPADKFFSYGIECGPHTILDTLNSSGGMLEQENHEDGCTVWDEQARRDLTYLAALVNTHRSGKLILAPNEALDIARAAE